MSETAEEQFSGNKDGDIELQTEDDERRKEEERRKAERKQEWGLQFDRWLIRAAKNQLPVELLLDRTYPSITVEGDICSGIPQRVDKYFIQMLINSVEVWINKTHIVGCKQVAGKAQFSDTNLSSASGEDN
jgi:hypothetical protein